MGTRRIGPLYSKIVVSNALAVEALELIQRRHRHVGVPGIDKVDVAGYAAGKIGKQIVDFQRVVTLHWS